MADRVVRYDDRARLRILEAYERRKDYEAKRGRKLTQGQFMLQGAPGARLDKAPGKFRNEESAARYFRKIKTGERSGGAMYRAGSQDKIKGLFQLRWKRGPGKDDYVSQNITVAGASTTFDIPAIEDELRNQRPADVKKLIDQWRSKYGKEAYDVDPDDVEVRLIRKQIKPIRMRLAIS